MTFHRRPTLAESAHYRVRVNGSIQPARLADLCGDWKIEHVDAGAHPQSVLVGQVVDQAELLGLLNQLYFNGLPLLSVEYLGGAPHEDVAQ